MSTGPMKNILLPTDFSKNSHNALLYAISYFADGDVNFYVLNVSDDSKNRIEDEYSKVIGSRSEIEKLREVILIANKLKINRNHIFFPIHENMRLVEAIKFTIQKKKIDFIVMGTKGSSNIKTIGSNTMEVITKVKCPIIVIPKSAKFKGIKTVAFPTDFNCIFKSKVVTTIFEVLAKRDAKLEILDVRSCNLESSQHQRNNLVFLEDFMKELPTTFHKLGSCNIELEIQKAVEKYNVDLIAVVAKNLNLIEKLLFNPDQKVRNYQAEIPFLVVHE